jgi:hypothetical protein
MGELVYYFSLPWVEYIDLLPKKFIDLMVDADYTPPNLCKLTDEFVNEFKDLDWALIPTDETLAYLRLLTFEQIVQHFDISKLPKEKKNIFKEKLHEYIQINTMEEIIRFINNNKISENIIGRMLEKVFISQTITEVIDLIKLYPDIILNKQQFDFYFYQNDEDDLNTECIVITIARCNSEYYYYFDNAPLELLDFENHPYISKDYTLKYLSPPITPEMNVQPFTMLSPYSTEMENIYISHIEFGKSVICFLQKSGSLTPYIADSYDLEQFERVGYKPNGLDNQYLYIVRISKEVYADYY